jgi:hypothetical protein
VETRIKVTLPDGSFAEGILSHGDTGNQKDFETSIALAAIETWKNARDPMRAFRPRTVTEWVKQQKEAGNI